MLLLAVKHRGPWSNAQSCVYPKYSSRLDQVDGRRAGRTVRYGTTGNQIGCPTAEADIVHLFPGLH
jgi:hypothetical protein